MTQVFCSACGAEAADDARFCPECGTTTDAAPSAQPATGGQRSRFLRWPGRRALMVAVPLAAVLAGAAIAASLVMGDAPEDHAVELVPADVAFYTTVHLDPSLGQKRAAKGALDRARGAGVEDATPDSLEDAIGDLVSDSTPLDYERDVKPHLGDQIALYARPQRSPTLLVATTDMHASLELMRRAMSDEYPDYRVVQDSHRGQPYEHVVYGDGGGSPSGLSAFTILDGFVVIGSDGDVKASIDARAGESLDRIEQFAAARGELSDDVLAAAYFDAGTLADAARASGYSSEEIDTYQAMGDGGPLAATLVARGGRLEFDFFAARSAPGDAQPLHNPSALLETLPGDAIATISLGDLGGPLGDALADGSSELEDELREALDELAGLNVEDDLVAWLGQVGLYVAGDDPDTVEGAVVAETRSPSDSDRALRQIESYNASDPDYDDYGYGYGVSVYASDDGLGFDVAGNGEVLQVRGDEDRVIAGMGAAGFSTDRALDAAGGFGESDVYRRATAALGGYEPFVVIDAPPLQSLLEQAADAGYDDSYMEDVRPWLSSIATVAGGVRADGDRLRIRLVAEIQAATTP